MERYSNTVILTQKLSFKPNTISSIEYIKNISRTMFKHETILSKLS